MNAHEKKIDRLLGKACAQERRAASLRRRARDASARGRSLDSQRLQAEANLAAHRAARFRLAAAAVELDYPGEPELVPHVRRSSWGWEETLP